MGSESEETKIENTKYEQTAFLESFITDEDSEKIISLNWGNDFYIHVKPTRDLHSIVIIKKQGTAEETLTFTNLTKDEGFYSVKLSGEINAGDWNFTVIGNDENDKETTKTELALNIDDTIAVTEFCFFPKFLIYDMWQHYTPISETPDKLTMEYVEDVNFPFLVTAYKAGVSTVQIKNEYEIERDDFVTLYDSYRFIVKYEKNKTLNCYADHTECSYGAPLEKLENPLKKYFK